MREARSLTRHLVEVGRRSSSAVDRDVTDAEIVRENHNDVRPTVCSEGCDRESSKQR